MPDEIGEERGERSSRATFPDVGWWLAATATIAAAVTGDKETGGERIQEGVLAVEKKKRKTFSMIRKIAGPRGWLPSSAKICRLSSTRFSGKFAKTWLPISPCEPNDWNSSENRISLIQLGIASEPNGALVHAFMF
jgi:hypothetical protein